MCTKINRVSDFNQIFKTIFPIFLGFKPIFRFHYLCFDFSINLYEFSSNDLTLAIYSVQNTSPFKIKDDYQKLKNQLLKHSKQDGERDRSFDRWTGGPPNKSTTHHFSRGRPPMIVKVATNPGITISTRNEEMMIRLMKNLD